MAKWAIMWQTLGKRIVASRTSAGRWDRNQEIREEASNSCSSSMGYKCLTVSVKKEHHAIK